MGVHAGDKGAWVWKPAGSKGLGNAATAQLNTRLQKITADARRAIEKAFEKEAEVERQEIGQRAIRNLERRTNQLLRVWSVSRLARCVNR